jgi:hypothetical protein
MDSVMMMLLYVSNDLNGFDDDEFTEKKKKLWCVLHCSCEIHVKI